MDITALDPMKLINLLFCIAIVTLGLIRYQKTAVKAFLFIGLAYALFGFSWLCQLFGLDVGVVKTILTGVRMAGYSMLIIGLIL